MKYLPEVLITFFVFALLVSCTNDDEIDAIDDTAIFMSYDMVSTTFTTPQNTDDASSITKAEKTLATPFWEGCHVEAKILFDGSVEAQIEMTSPEDTGEYPSNTVGGKMSFPEQMQTKTIRMENGVSTYYNSEGEVIFLNRQSAADMAFFESLVSDMSKNQQFSEEEFDAILESFRQAGYATVDNAANPNYAEMTLERSDGGSTVLLIDKQRQHVSSRIQLNANGEVESSSDWIFTEGDETNAHPLYHRFLTFYKSPFSDVQMAIQKVTKFNNFIIEKNL